MDTHAPELQRQPQTGIKIRSLSDLFERIPDEDAAVRFLFDLLYGEAGWKCPICGTRSRSLLIRAKKVQCTKCSHQQSVTKGTIMYRSKIPLRSWLAVHYLVAADRESVSAESVAQTLGCEWNVAHYMLQRILTSRSPL